MHRGLVALDVRRSRRMPLIGGIAVAGVLLYFALSLTFAIGSFLALRIIG